MNLLSAILEVLQNEINTKYPTGFSISNITYTASEIISNINVNLPTSAALTGDENGEITGVTITYKQLPLKNTSNTTSFNVTGFLSANNVGINTLSNQQVADKLSSLLSQTIDVSKWFSNITSANAIQLYDAVGSLPGVGTTVQQAIKNVISQECNNKLIFNGINYPVSDVINNIDITLPQSVTIPENVAGHITGIELSYNGETIDASNNASTFIADGFLQTTVAQSEANDNRNNLVTQDKLDSLLNQDIDVAQWFYNTPAENLLSISPSAILSGSSVSLQTAVQDEILKELNYLYPNGFSILCLTYTDAEVASSITITLPTNISLQDAEAGQISSVALFYNSIEIYNSAFNSPTSPSTDSYNLTGFEAQTEAQIGSVNNTSKQIVTKLDSLLSPTIDVSQWFSTYTASEAMQTDSLTTSSTTTLIQAIQDEIASEISQNYINGFTINNIAFTASEIANNIHVLLPTTISPTNDASAQIPNVSLSYDSITLQNTNKNTTFTITGFKDQTSQFTNQQIANSLDHLLNQDINISKYFANDTAANTIQTAYENTTLSSYQGISIQQAILDAISSTYTNKLIVQDVNYPISNVISNLSVNVPTYISLDSNDNGEIPDVTLSYSGIDLSSSNGDTSFDVTGFKQISASQTGINAQRNMQIGIDLNSLLNQKINLSKWFSNTTVSQIESVSLTSNCPGLNISLFQAVQDVVLDILNANDPNGIIVSSVIYTNSEISSYIGIELPNTISNANI
ncbi:MAG: hypothetical protein IIT97_01485, partial [Mycoplasmataceae bacterium]|nr:hypothetical protein [Mycoplasmataceae bacterium]